MTGDATIGPYLGRLWRLDKRRNIFWGLTATAGLSFLDIANNTTSGIRPDDPDDIVLGLSWSVGTMLEIEVFTVGVVFGADWDYNGYTWLSFSIGHHFLQPTKKQ